MSSNPAERAIKNSLLRGVFCCPNIKIFLLFRHVVKKVEDFLSLTLFESDDRLKFNVTFVRTKVTKSRWGTMCLKRRFFVAFVPQNDLGCVILSGAKDL